MVEVWLPYGGTEVPVRIPAENYAGTLDPKETPALGNVTLAVQEAVTHPLGTQTLSSLLGPEVSVAVQANVVDARSTYRLLLPYVFREMEAAGVPSSKARLIATTGLAPPLDREAITKALDGIVPHQFGVSRHDPTEDPSLTTLGQTSRGIRVDVNREYLQSDVRIVTGEVRFHGYMGYCGGGESVSIELAGMATLAQIHALLPSEKTRAGVLQGNPIHESMLDISGMAPETFAINMVRDAGGNPVGILAGRIDEVFQQGVKQVNELLTSSVGEPIDVAIASAGGAPQDSTLSGSVAAIENVLSIVKPGGLVVLVAECREGYGSAGFDAWTRGHREYRTLERAVRLGWEFGAETAFLLRRAQQSVRVVLVSALPDLYATEGYGLRTAPTGSSAVNLALRIAGRRARIAVIPHASSVHPSVHPSEVPAMHMTAAN